MINLLFNEEKKRDNEMQQRFLEKFLCEINISNRVFLHE